MEKVRGDTLTIVSVALLAYITGNIVHEALGHGLACIATGGKPILVTTVSMECSAENRVVMAGGTIANVIAAMIFFGCARVTRSTARYFFWFCATINLFAASGYFLFSGVGGFGDWAMFIEGLPNQLLWRIGLTMFGGVAYMLTARFSLLEMRPLIGNDSQTRYSRSVELTRIPYFAGGTLACIAGCLNPGGMILVGLSAAASTFGGASGLLWMTQWLRGNGIPLGPDPEPSPIGRSWPWIIAAAIGACVFITVLGRGVRFAR